MSHTAQMVANTECEISRFDIHNISKIEIVINRYSNINIKGEFRVIYKNESNNWIEILKLSENENLSPRDEWEVFSMNINEDNYEVKFIFNKKILIIK